MNIHIVCKNLQSILEETRFEDFLQGLADIEYDIAFSSETWREERQEIVSPPQGGIVYFSGGSAHRGVGIGISKQFLQHISGTRFHAYSPRLCALDFTLQGKRFRAFSVYFPTTWDSDEAVQEVYDNLSLLFASNNWWGFQRIAWNNAIRR